MLCCLVTVARPSERVALLTVLECMMVWSPWSDEGSVTAQQQRWRPHRQQHCNLHLLLSQGSRPHCCCPGVQHLRAGSDSAWFLMDF